MKPEALVMLGAYDHTYRRELGVSTIAGRVELRSAEEVIASPDHIAREAVRRISSHATYWWLHTDLDVLAESEFRARGFPGETPLSAD